MRHLFERGWLLLWLLACLGGCATRTVINTNEHEPLDGAGVEAMGRVTSRTSAPPLPYTSYWLTWKATDGGGVWRAEELVVTCEEFLRSVGTPRESGPTVPVERIPATARWLGPGPHRGTQTLAAFLYKDRHIIVSLDPLLVITVAELIAVVSRLQRFDRADVVDGVDRGQMILASAFEYGSVFEAAVPPNAWYCPTSGRSSFISFEARDSIQPSDTASFRVVPEATGVWRVTRDSQ